SASMSVAPDANNIPPGTAVHGWLAIGGERVEGGWRYPAPPSATPRVSGSARSRAGTPRQRAALATPPPDRSLVASADRIVASANPPVARDGWPVASTDSLVARDIRVVGSAD
ncbi:MAG: hypothetical protein K2W85_16205, partial [Phycisphaerales bacterium]|nr:hypothetical protein [Phycisphaerales bacterium]